MEIWYGFPQAREKKEKVVLTIGFYDGIHQGHQKIIEKLKKEAELLGGKSALVTFDPSSFSYLFHHPLPLLTTWEEKKEILEKAGIELIILLSFTRRIASLSPYSFIKKLNQGLKIKKIIVGEDFVFGKDREGNIFWLKEKESELGYKLEVVPLLKKEGRKISSSLLRTWLSEGKIEEVTRWLNRSPTLIGKVIRGEGRGYSLGYPTANIKPHRAKLLPISGVYAGRVFIGKKIYKGIVNIGEKPTFGDKSFGVEVHIINFQKNIYGKNLKIELIKKIREIEKFPSSFCLVKRIEKDKRRVEELLG
ncbi:bifunctional riboflavin kinase/FAD synthetase [Candidatus Aerophobetes bacterium]|nr:bifunctional riboflavin kinase/FAD synthetase [Candidatus Aerophobetes bacterium]